MLSWTTYTVSVGDTIGFTVIIMILDVAVVGDAQDELEVNMHFTVWPLVRLLVVNVALFVPAFAPLTSH